jgi:hypothetical protein
MEKYIFVVVVLVLFVGGFFLNRKKSVKNISEGLILFPHWFKQIGILLAFLSFVVVEFLDFPEEDIWRVVSHHGINLGLFVVCFSKDRLEDELTNFIRLRAFYTSVIVGFMVVILAQSLIYLIGDENAVYPARNLITMILVVYAFSFASLKRKVFYGK